MCPLTHLSNLHVTSLLWTSTALYFCAFLSGLIPTLLNRETSHIPFYTLLSTAFILQILALYTRGLSYGSFPILSTFEILQIISSTAILLTLIIQITFSLKLLPLFGSALTSLINLFSLLLFKLPNTPSPSCLSTNPWVEFHIELAILAYSIFGLLSISSFMYLLQDHGLSHKSNNYFYRKLPSLSQLSTFTHKILLLGILFYSLALIIGTFTWLSGSHSLSLQKLLPPWSILLLYILTASLLHKKIISLKLAALFNLLNFILALLFFWTLKSS